MAINKTAALPYLFLAQENGWREREKACRAVQAIAAEELSIASAQLWLSAVTAAPSGIIARRNPKTMNTRTTELSITDRFFSQVLASLF